MKDKILFITVAKNSSNRKRLAKISSSPPIGLLSISAILKMHGYKTEIIDMLVEDISQTDFKNILSEFSPDLIGISTYTETYLAAVEVAQFAKKILPNVKILFGGVHVTFLPEETMKNKVVDYVTRHEGEFTTLELMEHLNNPSFPIEKIQGLVYRNGDDVIINETRPSIEYLDAIPLNDIDDSKKKLYFYDSCIVSSRGCPGGCIYCASRAFSGAKYRCRSAENLFCEIYYKYKRYNEQYFHIFDDTFTADVKRLKKFCSLIKLYNVKIEWRCESRADILSEEIIDMIYDTGCKTVHIGIESGSQKILDQLKKHIKLEKAERMVKYMSQKGIRVMCSFMIGHHCDTRETIMETINLANKFREEYNAGIAYGVNTPFPGTYLYNHAKELGVKIETNIWSNFDLFQPVISTANLSIDELREIAFACQLETVKGEKNVRR